MSSVELAPGLIVDTERGTVYLANPGGGISAVALSSGTDLWESPGAAKPLAVAGDLLVGQVEVEQPGNQLRIAALRTDAEGAVARESVVPMPEGVEPVVGQMGDRTFEASAQPVDGDVELTWEFVETPRRGLNMDLVEVLPGEEEDAAELEGVPGAVPGAEPAEVVRRGRLRFSPQDGRVEPMAEPAGSEGFPGSAELPPGDDADGDAQFLSGDGRHVLRSKRLEDDGGWNAYAWTIFDRESGDELGSLRMQASYSPFVVADGLLVYESQPHADVVDGEMREAPLEVRAIRIEDGERVWTRAVRDPVDTTPPPP